MKAENRKPTEVLNELVKINNDRIEGYQKAEGEARDMELKSVFRNMANESKKHVKELLRELKKEGVSASGHHTSFLGNIYRTWMEIKATLTGRDRLSLLSSCAFGEEAAQTAYRNAISCKQLSNEARQLVRNQQVSLRIAQELIRSFRDGYPQTFKPTILR